MVTKPIVSLDAVRALLPVRAGNTSIDAKLTLYTTVATEQIEAIARRSFTYQEHAQTFSTAETRRYAYDFADPSNLSGIVADPRHSRFVLRGMPVDDAEDFKVYYDPNRVFGEDTLVDATDYVVDYENGILVLTAETGEFPSALKVTYTAGYAVDGVSDSLNVAAPADLRMACITQVMHLYTRLSPDNVGLDSDNGQSKSAPRRFTAAGGLTPEAATMVFKYRQPLLGRS